MPGDEEKALEEIKRLQQEEADSDTQVVEVEEPDEEEEPKEVTPRQAARRERASKFKEAQERAAAAERERDDYRAKVAALEAARQYTTQAPPKDEPKPDPADKDIEALDAEMQELQDQYAQLTTFAEKAQQAIDPKVVASFRAKWAKLNTSKNEKIAEKVQRRTQVTTQQQGPSAEQAAQAAALRVRYSDIVSHPEANRIAAYAAGLWQAHRARGGSDTVEEMDRVVNDARRVFGLAKSPPPSAATKARFAGVGAGATAANGETNGDAAKRFPINKQMIAQATAAYPDLPEKKAVQKFIQVQLKRGVKTA